MRAAVHLAAFAAVVAACGDTTHVFVGRLYVEDRDCLGSTSSVEVVEGDPAASNCAPACLVQSTTPDRQPRIYVSTMCPPFPYGFDAGGGDPRCALALSALDRGDECLSDGGSTEPLPKDAGGD